MDMLLTLPAYLGLVLHVAVFVYYAKSLPLGAMSLPCLTAITSFLYFYLMPALMLMGGADNMLGMYLKSLEETHWISILYLLGAVGAFSVFHKAVAAEPRADDVSDPGFNWLAYRLIGLVCLAGITALFASGQLNVFRTENYDTGTEATGIAFLGLSISMSLSLTLIYLVIDNFRIKSVSILFVVLYVYIVAGFRFRMLILLCAAMICFATMRHIRLRPTLVVAGAAAGIFLMNFVGAIRKYGAGPNLDALDDLDWSNLFTRFGGEAGMVFTTQYAAENPPQPIYFDPWIVAVGRFVPTFIWPDKPYPEYLRLIAAGFTTHGADSSGMAAPQQVEMIYQFGWAGLPALAFLYFTLIVLTGKKISELVGPPRLAGLALLPPFFGYYMQSRGYFFQMIAEAIFTFSPLFIIAKCSGHFGSKVQSKIRRSTRTAALSPRRTTLIGDPTIK